MARREEGKRFNSRRSGETPGTLQISLGSEGTVTLELHPCVYNPSEDSQLLVDALVKLKSLGRVYDRIADVGSGTGILALAAYKLFNPSVLIAVDISPYAVELSRRNLPPEVHVLRCWGFSCLNGVWDLVILNPPYLPEEPPQKPLECLEWLEYSWSGSKIMYELLLDSFKTSREVLTVYSTLSPVDPEALAVKSGFKIKNMGSRRFFYEELRAILAYRGD